MKKHTIVILAISSLALSGITYATETPSNPEVIKVSPPLKFIEKTRKKKKIKLDCNVNGTEAKKTYSCFEQADYYQPRKKPTRYNNGGIYN